MAMAIVIGFDFWWCPLLFGHPRPSVPLGGWQILLALLKLVLKGYILANFSPTFSNQAQSENLLKLA